MEAVQDSTDPREATVFRAHAAPQGTCEQLNNALNLLTNQQKDGDSPVGKIVTGLWERSRSRTMDGLRKCISEDKSWESVTYDHQAVDPKKVRPVQKGDFLRKYVSRRLFALSEGEIAGLTTAMRQLGVGSQGGA